MDPAHVLANGMGAGTAVPAGCEEAEDGPHHNPSVMPVPAAALSPRDPWAARWGHLLRTARQVSGLSLAAVSAASGLSKGYLSKLESGAPAAANPSRATLAALARTLPAFRPLAHSLEPDHDSADLDYSRVVPSTPPEAGASTPSLVQPTTLAPGLLQLGWRELEVLAVLLILESSAAPVPITFVLLARACGRTTSAVRMVLDHLTAQGIVTEDLPARPGAMPVYRATPDATARMGVTHVGDLLVLAASLLAGAVPAARATPPPASPTGSAHVTEDATEDGTAWDTSPEDEANR